MNPIEIPQDVQSWLRGVFDGCDARIAEKLSNNPNLPEESLDLTWIEHLSQFASPVVLPSSWTVKLDSHYLGGLRHFRRWEIADIGVLLFIRRAGVVERRKVALLQSKRLYPLASEVLEESRIDYEIGFARLADPEDLSRSISLEAHFEFSDACRYGALRGASEQVSAIRDYEAENELPVYYQFYNPWRVPFEQTIPLTEYRREAGAPQLGTRIIPAKAVHALLSENATGFKPSLRDVRGLVGEGDGYGWPLGHFIVDLFLACKEGSVFDSWSDDRIGNLFYRRSGPIAAAISIVVEAPAAEQIAAGDVRPGIAPE
jgi:hypothetical protein